MSDIYKIALAGNPNSGKSSLFNALTGLNQKVGNFPGVTVDKKLAGLLSAQASMQGLSIYPVLIVYIPKVRMNTWLMKFLLNPKSKERPDLTLVVADASNLKRNLLFCSQIIDLKLPVIIVLSMMDIARTKGITVDVKGLEREMGVPVVVVNPRKNKGLNQLKKVIAQMHGASFQPLVDFVPLQDSAHNLIQKVKRVTDIESNYGALHIASGIDNIEFITKEQQRQIKEAIINCDFHKGKIQAEEVMQRYERIAKIMQMTVVEESPLKKQLFTEAVDKVLLHRVWGNIILLVVLFIMFQCVFWLAEYPMNWIESSFAWMQGQVSHILPEVWWSDLLVNGLLAGIGGILVFVPQIALLFGIITVLEDSGYMARISFLTDRLMRSAGLNGRSVMPLISGMACAIPAVMAARTIENKKERLITILITPLMSCSARLPIYVILIALVIPPHTYLGFIKLQALVMMGLYLLGFFTALIVAKVMSILMKNKENSIFLMELPVYRAPRWKNALMVMYEKAKIFIFDAGKVIIIIALILWALASYGPPGKMDAVEKYYAGIAATQNDTLTLVQSEQKATDKLEQSYAGLLGKAIEPVIRPLGYDWKMGIALISSFAAREVFVGTMATLYSVGEADETSVPLRQKMANEKRADGSKVYTLATGVSLMIFYAFAMQCMSTIAIVRRETKTWKWPLIQMAYMTGLAYLAALIAFQILK